MRDPVQDPHKPMGELPANAELRVLVERIVEVANGREEAAGVLARKIFARLYEVSGSLCGPRACTHFHGHYEITNFFLFTRLCKVSGWLCGPQACTIRSIRWYSI